MELTELIKHPERMDKETLYDLRSLIALYPYFQTARLLMLQNLYILHDPSFDEELRRAAIYITDRKMIFNMVEAAHYRLHTKPRQQEKAQKPGESRTVALIDDFLDSIPADSEEEKNGRRKPTPADAAVDYVSYLLETESEEEKQAKDKAPQLKGQDLIDNFINNEGGKITLQDEPEFMPEIEEEEEDRSADTIEQGGYATETLARIYIKQGRYDTALEIMKKLDLTKARQNIYFVDQIRFLEKLIVNSKNK